MRPFPESVRAAPRALGALLLLAGLPALPAAPESPDNPRELLQWTDRERPSPEGPLTVVRVTTPDAFKIEKRYRSMEGPWQRVEIRPEKTPEWATLAASCGAKTKELLWWKGATIEVVDAETGQNLGPEFMCHLNLDVDARAQQAAFPGWPWSPARLLTLTQGEMHFELPPGYGVPFPSDAVFTALFQVLNHNRDGKFKVRQRLTLYFVRDRDLFVPLQPVTWYVPFVFLPLDGNLPAGAESDRKLCPCCVQMPTALNAPNNTSNGTWTDVSGRRMSGHWQVPPGRREWRTPAILSSPGFPVADSRVVASWSHVHPFCEDLRLIHHDPKCGPVEILRNTVVSLGGGKVGLDKIRSFHSTEGVPLPPGSYEVAVSYHNTSPKPQDSMASLGLYLTLPTFLRPEWASRADNANPDAISCGTPPPPGAKPAQPSMH